MGVGDMVFVGERRRSDVRSAKARQGREVEVIRS